MVCADGSSMGASVVVGDDGFRRFARWRAAGGFGDADGFNDDGFGELHDEFVGDVLGDALGGGVDRVEGGVALRSVLLKGAVMRWRMLGGVEVAEQAFVVELRRGECDAELPVVAMQWFALALDHDGVGAQNSCSISMAKVGLGVGLAWRKGRGWVWL